ncbi:hypothetical protein AVEN_186765-1 [Araneus ventricosus]|uniref:Uncharacterized protein n=1 Tax=Araneus ventricosus TaxID=182803 RepID=A0A4Y2NMT2_ARAVE|nr:hypothetical protein AVEN_186765-1 [Araneus ventricosus]
MLHILVGDFSSNLVTMADVLNQMFGKVGDGRRDVAAFVERSHHVLKSQLNFSVQKPFSDKAETLVLSKVHYVRQEQKPDQLLGIQLY